MPVRFTKMHGIGNDYVYVDLFDQQLNPDPRQLAKAMSDRNKGIGSDGLILIRPSDRADARMQMFNADGSEGEMCGNGIRCVAKYLYDYGIAAKNQVTVETGRGVLTLEIEASQGKAEHIRVDMGSPILEGSLIPTTLPGNPPLDVPFEAAGMALRLTAVSMGNPHAVAFLDDLDHFPLERVGQAVELDPRFPNRVNAHFVTVLDRSEVRMVTWERGSGPTKACGTGACAVCVAGVLTSRTERRIVAHLPGGDLQVDWPTEGASVFMTGPATEVFQGEWPD